jgi:hypothetical protein
MRKLWSSSWGRAAVQVVDDCAQTSRLHTTNVFRFLRPVRKLGGFARGSTSFIPLLMHSIFAHLTEVNFRLMPTIPSTYKNNNKRIYIKLHTFIGAPS